MNERERERENRPLFSNNLFGITDLMLSTEQINENFIEMHIFSMVNIDC